ncbi:MAG: DUF169 domain-containing protein [bacterium]|nr:DUF169 domain-containing protein [bacterium]
MDICFKDEFRTRWRSYFGSAELPITFEYTEDERDAEPLRATTETRCLIAALQLVREGKSLRFDARSFGCAGGKFYCGYSTNLRSGIAEFLAHDEMGEGERYKKNPDVAAEAIRQVPWHKAPATHLIFKRWDKLDKTDAPHAAIFFATADVLAGLFTLAGYDVADRDGALMIPFSSGCGSIITYPYAESLNKNPRAVLGMFDVSARPFVPSGVLSFSVPMKKLRTMVDNMDESFLITESWERVRSRIR